MLNFIQVQSSSIEALKHDSISNELFVIFKSGELYKYNDVNSNEFTELLKAESIGSHFHKHIKSSKKFTKFKES